MSSNLSTTKLPKLSDPHKPIREVWVLELPIIGNDQKKNPDAINLKTGILIDFKNAQGTNGKNAVQSAIKEASKQGVEEVVIRFQERIDGWATLSLARGLKAGLLPGRARNLSLITIISPTGEKVSLNVKDIRERIDRLGKKKKGI